MDRVTQKVEYNRARPKALYHWTCYWKDQTFICQRSFFSWLSHLFKVDALARWVWASDDFDSVMWIWALERVGHKHRRAQLQQWMSRKSENSDIHSFIIHINTTFTLCVYLCVVYRCLFVCVLCMWFVIRRMLDLLTWHDTLSIVFKGFRLQQEPEYLDKCFHLVCECLPALCDCYPPVAG